MWKRRPTWDQQVQELHEAMDRLQVQLWQAAGDQAPELLPAPHPGAASGTDDGPQRCDLATGTHVSPHRGCLLR